MYIPHNKNIFKSFFIFLIIDKKRGVVIIISLVLLLGVIDAAWILSYKQTITAKVIGEKFYSISEEFDSTISLNTSDGPDTEINLMKIESNKDRLVDLDATTRRTNLTSEEECDYEDDCIVTWTYIHDGIKEILINKQTITNNKNFTLLEGEENYIEYKIECVEDSCAQRIASNVTIEGI
jgi:hypothetical protein